MRPIDHLVTVDWLREHGRDPDLRVVDVRWKLGDSLAGRHAYEGGHLPGAVFLDVDRDLAAPPGSGPGRHPIPSPGAFATAMERSGLGDHTRVVAYDDAGGAYAARLWFLLRYFDHETGAILDGGIQAWTAAGLPLESGAPNVTPRERFTARPRPELIVDLREVDRLRREPSALVVDARAGERYRGETEPVDPRAGHIPGAKNAPFAANLASPGGSFQPAEELRRRFSQLGAERARDIVCYCGSGVTACHDLMALELAGFRGARLYEGSWSDWSSAADTDVATGPEPGTPARRRH